MTDAPHSLAERFALAAKMARGGCSIDEIVAATGITEQSAKSIKQREHPDFSDTSGLRKTTREIAE